MLPRWFRIGYPLTVPMVIYFLVIVAILFSGSGGKCNGQRTIIRPYGYLTWSMLVCGIQILNGTVALAGLDDHCLSGTNKSRMVIATECCWILVDIVWNAIGCIILINLTSDCIGKYVLIMGLLVMGKTLSIGWSMFAICQAIIVRRYQRRDVNAEEMGDWENDGYPRLIEIPEFDSINGGSYYRLNDETFTGTENIGSTVIAK